MLLREILRQLSLVSPYSMPVGALRESCRAGVKPWPGEEEFRGALQRLQIKGRIVREVDELTEDELWKLKEDAQ